METLRRDLALTLRALRRSPGLTAAVVLTLALGIGAAVALYGLVDAVLVESLPYPSADRLTTLWQTRPDEPEPTRVSPGNYLDWRDRARSFAAVAAAEPYGFDLELGEVPERVPAWLVTPDFFALAGVPAARGRALAPSDGEGDLVVALSHDSWLDRFGGDPGIVGRTLSLSGEPHTVVGVMPPGFELPEARELWVPRPVPEDQRQVRNRTNLVVVAELAPGTSVGQAAAEMRELAAQLEREHPQSNAGSGVTVVPLREHLLGEVEAPLFALLAGALFLLLLACANVSNLLVVRGIYRQHELAARAALGAGRRRIAMQLGMESLLLTAGGLVLGVAVAAGTLAAVRASTLADLPRFAAADVDGTVVLFAVALAAAITVVTAWAPLSRLSRVELREVLQEGGRGSVGGSRGLLRGTLIVVQIVLAVVLLSGAALLSRSLLNVLAVDLGFEPRNVAALETHVWGLYPDPEARARFVAAGVERLAAMPEVEEAGAVSSLPFLASRIDRDAAFAIEGRHDPEAEQELPHAFQTVATPGYFRAMGVPLRAGRLLEERDRAGAPEVALVSETLAQRHWPAGDALGTRIVTWHYGQPATREIVGIVGDVRHAGVESQPRPEVFVPHAQDAYGSMTWVARGRDGAPHLPALEAALRELDPRLSFSGSHALAELVAETLRQRRFALLVLGLFAALAAALVTIGIYGLMSFASAERRQEIAVRMAMGAGRGDVLRGAFAAEARYVVLGVAAGVFAALFASRLLGSLLYGVGAADPWTYLFIVPLLLAIALLATWVPARRSLAVDAGEALRRG